MWLQLDTVKHTEEHIWGFNFVNRNEQSKGHFSGSFSIMCVSKTASQLALMQILTLSLPPQKYFSSVFFHNMKNRKQNCLPNQAGVTILCIYWTNLVLENAVGLQQIEMTLPHPFKKSHKLPLNPSELLSCRSISQVCKIPNFDFFEKLSNIKMLALFVWGAID